MENVNKYSTGKINDDVKFVKTYHNAKNMKGLNTQEIYFLMYLIAYQENNEKVFISNSYIKTNLFNDDISISSIKRWLNNIENLGYISRISDKDNNTRIISITQLTYDIINGIITPQEELKLIKQVLVSKEKDVLVDTTKNNVNISTSKTKKVMKNKQTKGERDFEIELNNLEKTIQEQIIPINLDGPISITDLRPTPTTTITKEEVKVKVKMYDKDEPITTKEAIKLLFPVPDKRSEYLVETIERFNGFQLEGKDFQLTPDTLSTILNNCYPELTERVQNRTK